MLITYDPAKRAKTLADRGLDFEDADEAFDPPSFTYEDIRFTYPEARFITVGFVAGRMVIVVWTPKPRSTHIISMRKANEREQRRYAPYL
jgi:uncharacterized DUF497 family protein